MPLKTTVVGSWPKPDCLNIPDWFSEQGNFSSEELSGLTGMGGGYDPRSAIKAREDENMEDNIKQAVKEVIDEQVALGIDVVTDGEMERGAYYIHVMNTTHTCIYGNLLLISVLCWPLMGEHVKGPKGLGNMTFGISPPSPTDYKKHSLGGCQKLMFP